MIQNDVLSSAKEEGKMEGRLEGITEGRMDERLKNAKGMKNLGIASDKIAEITGLSSEDVEKL
jgi:predicted transposase/invertase (TIGR01784 family)